MPIRNIVVEGPNNVGKTTLIKMLRSLELFKDWRVEHMHENSPNSYEFYDASLKYGNKTIYDRHCIGEVVYPQLFNRKTDFTLHDCKNVVIENEDTLFVFVTADYTFIKQAYDKKCEKIDWKFVINERAAFDAIYDGLRDCNNVMIFSHGEDTDNFVEFVNKLVCEV